MSVRKSQKNSSEERLGQSPAGQEELRQTGERNGNEKRDLKLEQVKNQKAVGDVYTRMRILKTQLESNPQLHLTQEQQLQRLKRSINLMQEKFKS